MSRCRHGPALERYVLIGADATLTIEFKGGFSYVSAEPFQMYLYGDSSGSYREMTVPTDRNIDLAMAHDGRYARELRHFIECVRTGARPRTTGADGLKAVEAITATFFSSWTGKSVDMPFDEEFDLPSSFEAARNTTLGAESA